MTDPAEAAAPPSDDNPGRLDRVLGHRVIPWLAPFLAILVAAPVLKFGFFSDDFFLFSLLDQGRVEDLYVFATGDPAQTMPWVTRGPFGWWTDPELQFRFFRPLGARLLQWNWLAWGRDPVPYHLVALAWNALIVVSAGLVLRRVLSPATAGLALLLYAVDESRGLPVAWIANHYMLPCAVFGWLAVYAHLRWREGLRAGGLLSALALALSLGFGESGLCAAAFIVAQVGFGGRTASVPPSPRWKALAPTVSVLAAWAVLYELGDYGAAHSGTYVDPHMDPLRYLTLAPSRIAALVASLLAGFPADAWVLLPSLRVAEATVGVLALAGMAWTLRRVFPDLAPAERHALRWMLPGAALALLPVLATFPTDRLLLFPSLACLVLAATLVRWGVATKERWGRWLAAALLLIQGVLPVLGWGAQGVFGVTLLADIDTLMDSSALADIEGRTVILPGVSNPYASMYLSHTRWFRGEGQPARLWPLTMTPHDLRMTRPDATTLTVEVIDGEMMGTPFEDLFRAKGFVVGEVTVLDGATITVDQLGPHGGPTHLTLRTDVPLDDPSVRVLELHAGHLVRIDVPPPGGSWRARWEPGPGGL